MYNKAILIGNLGKNPEGKTTEGGTRLCKFSLATTGRKDDQGNARTEWHNIIAWGKLAEICEKYLHKGKQVMIEGEIRTREYEKDGVKKWFTEIHAFQMKMLGSKSDNQSSSNAGVGDDVPFGGNGGGSYLGDRPSDPDW